MTLHMSDLNGFDVPDLPAVLPASKAKPPSVRAAIRACLNGIYNTDEVFRERLGSLDNKSAQSGVYHYDKAYAAASILKYATDNTIKALSDADKPLAKIKRHLPDILKEFELDRQSRLRKAIEDGRAARAAHTEDPRG